MPILGALLVNLITGFAAFLVKFVSQKIAVALALTTLLSGLIAGLYVAARGALALANMGAAAIDPGFAAGVSVVISPRVSSLLTAYLTLWVAVELYKWKVNLLQLWARTI